MALKTPLSPLFFFFFFFLFFLFLTIVLQPNYNIHVRGARSSLVPYRFTSSVLAASEEEEPAAETEDKGEIEKWGVKGPRRWLIGSTAPTCTFQCRGCRFKCRAEQVPVDANDPVNSAYRYRCVCHR